MIIHDQSMSKYFIDDDGNNFILFENTNKTIKDKNTGAISPVREIHGYFTDLNICLTYLARRLTTEKISKTKIITLRMYIRELTQIKIELEGLDAT